MTELLDIIVFPMMQEHMGYWWAVQDVHGHILKLGRANTREAAVIRAETWAEYFEAQAVTVTT